jgi:antitoxin component YwqK of YwqJK toxin-antitoxin module
MNDTREAGWNSIHKNKLQKIHYIKPIVNNMKKHCLISLVVIFSLSSCIHETKVMEEAYPNGSPKRECVYKGKDASRELIRETTWYPNKKIQMTGEYKEKKRNGRWVYYYSNGNVWSEGFFKDGKSDGKRIMYNENGKVFIEGFYKDDRRTGVWKYYDEKGSLVKTVDYTDEFEKGLKPSL